MNIARTFWSAVIEERSLKAGFDALSFEYLGDFIFAGHVVTEVHPFFARFLRK